MPALVTIDHGDRRLVRTTTRRDFALERFIPRAATPAESLELTRAENRAALEAKAATALANNATFLGLANPTQAQAVQQVQRLTRQVDALIRLSLDLTDDTLGT